MPVRNAIASLAVRDLTLSLAWYERLLGRPADSRPMAALGEWRFERGGWLQIYEGPERAGSGSVTLAVTSLDEQLAVLRERGFGAAEPIISEKVKVVMIEDPDGNSIAFAEALDPTIAQ
jgi:catechol 2,3-dioxygenase-like lactoylglutathione lyase family enzyme